MNQVSVSIDESNYQNPYELDEILNFIKSVIKKKNRHNNYFYELEKSSNEICSICLENLSLVDFDIDSDKSCKISCNHCFHKKCISNWLDNYKNCPLCRKKCVENEKIISQ